MNAPTDFDRREQALDPRFSFIVQAPAGSGKTELLTRRILTLLARVERPEEILAITFTRKAAAEMRQRVIGLLEQAADDVPIADDYEKKGRELAQNVLLRSESLGWNLVENPGRLQLQTIDSFCAVLTRQLPVTSNFGGVLEVAQDASPFYMLAAERCIERTLVEGEDGSESLSVLLKHLDTNVDRLQNMMKDMLANRDQWLRHYHKVSGSREEMEEALFALIDARYSVFAASVPPALDSSVLPLLQHAGYCCKALASRVQFPAFTENSGFLPPTRQSAFFWRDIANLLLTKDGGCRKRVDRNVGFPTNDKDAKALGLDSLYLREKNEAIKGVLGDIAEDENFLTGLQQIRTLPNGGYTDQQWLVMQALIELILMCVAELHLVFRDQGTVDFSEISMRASKALGALEDPTDLALALDYRIQHILVDEFQDTSISQFELFEKLVSGWEHNDGRTFFAVGDPMQSIYLFRDAEVSLFLQAGQNGIGSVRLKPLRLECNFRSDPALVNWSNAIFGQIFPKRENISTGAISYAPSTSFRDASPGAGQHIHPLIGQDREQEAEQVVTLVENALRAENPPESIAILVRSKMNLARVFPRLQQRGIPYQAIDIETLGDRLVVKDILSLARALQHPLDRLSWLSVLHAPYCGLELTDLHALVEGNSGEPVWSLLTDTETTGTLSDEGRERVVRLVEVLEAPVGLAVRDAFVPWLEASWLRLGGPASCLTDADLLAADACFTELGRIEGIGRLWDQSYINAQMKRLFAPASSADAIVQMMTIHKSKGLEFDMVILPGLGRHTRSDQSQLLNWFECQSEHGESRLLMAPVLEKGLQGNHKDPILEFVKAFRQEKSGNELLRLLYVAATRAKKELHLVAHALENSGGDSGQLKEPTKSSLLSPLWPQLSAAFGDPIAREDETEDDERKNPQMLSRIKRGWRAPDLTAKWQIESSAVSTQTVATVAPEFEWAGMTARLTGTLIHRQIQRVADEGLEVWSAKRVESCRSFYKSQLEAQGVVVSSLDSATDTVVRAMLNLVSDEKARWLLDTTHEQSVSEYRLTGVYEGVLVNGIIDRTFVGQSGLRWIVDFKTGNHLGSDLDAFLDQELSRYRPQLERYAAVMNSLDSTPIRLGLYFPLLRGWREWEPTY